VIFLLLACDDRSPDIARFRPKAYQLRRVL